MNSFLLLLRYLQEVVVYNAGEELLSKLSKQCEASQEAVAESPKKAKEKDREIEKEGIDKSKSPPDVKKTKSKILGIGSPSYLRRKSENHSASVSSWKQ
jgi:hypothetical protein